MKPHSRSVPGTPKPAQSANMEGQTMSTAVTPTPEQAAPLSQMERMVNIFVAPSKTFADLKRDTSWWMPFLAMALCSWIFVGSVDKKIGFDQVVDNTLANMSESQKARMEQ